MQTGVWVFVLSLGVARVALPRTDEKRETTMSPFCLIDVAGIRDHSTVPHDVPDSRHYARRLIAWLLRVFHVGHA